MTDLQDTPTPRKKYAHTLQQIATDLTDGKKWGYAFAPLRIAAADIVSGSCETMEDAAQKCNNQAVAMAMCRPDGSLIYSTLDVELIAVDGLTDDELLDRAKQQLTDLRATQAEIAKRHNARQTPAKAVCGHNARDHSGLCCDDPSCPRYVPF